MATAPDEVTDSLLMQGPWMREHAPFALLEVKGRDAADFLQRLCSQDVQGLRDGELAPAAFLDAKGKLQHTCVVVRSDAAFWLEVQEHQAAGLLALLDHYRFTEQVTFTRAAGECAEWVMCGPPAIKRPPVRMTVKEPGGIMLHQERRAVHFMRTHAAPEAFARIHSTFPAARPLDDTTAELLRMGAGIVRVGTDTEPGTLALEADLDDHVSLTKGCFTGQEIVARINTYGHVNRRLVLLYLAGEGSIAQPTQLVEPEDGIAVGRVMRALPVPGRALRMGLGYLPRDFQAVGTKLRLHEASGPEVTVAGFGG